MSDIKTLEENFKDIESIINGLNSDEISLDKAFADYKQGLDLIKSCSEQIAGIEAEIKVLTANGDFAGETIDE